MVCGQIFLLSSCKEEIVDPNKRLSGEKVSVNIALNDVIYHANEVVTRSNASLFKGEKEQWVGESVRLGDDLLMYTTLEVDQDVKTRTATSNLLPGSRIRVIAYINGTTYEAHADYTVNNYGDLVPDIEVLKISAGNYRFVAYSYNTSATLPAYNSATDIISNINPSIDLLWGCYPTTGGTFPVNESTFEAVPITMSHMFSQVKVQFTSVDIPGYFPINAISNVSLSPGKTVNLTVKDTIFTPVGDYSQSFPPPWTGLGSTIVTGQPILVNPNGSPYTDVNIGSLTLGTLAPFSNRLARFDKQLQRGVSYTLLVHFKRLNILIDDPRPADMLMYVGAFWRQDQTGERLIRIQRPSSNPAAADGAWTATVMIGQDWIVLDKAMTTDPNVGWRPGAYEANVHNGRDSNFDILHPVSSNVITVSGNLGPSDPAIYFRIGLRSTFQAHNTQPARYGIVLLTYNNNSKRHRIWIRQGEDGDYLMTNADPYYGTSTLRTETKRFSPYNLTAFSVTESGNFPVRVDKSGTYPPVNPSDFTYYPSQAGAFFQWATVSGYSRSVWNPYQAGSQSSWTQSTENGLWDAIKAEHETCPPEYRRPNDGATYGFEPCINIYSSELRQSIFHDPKPGRNYDSDLKNTSWGYYADGFFDRRQIVSSVTGEAFSTVAVNTRDVAYIGRLFFNQIDGSSHYGASIFFPAGGNRQLQDGALLNAGFDGSYWSSSRYNSGGDGDFGLGLRIMSDFYTNAAGVWTINRPSGVMIRCVRRDEPN
jgi:hypothetical protein